MNLWTRFAVVLTLGLPNAAFAGLAPDADGDGIPDVLDKCSIDSRNATGTRGCDTDSDGYGNVCDGDFNQSFGINATDFGQFFVPAFKGLDKAPWPQGMDMDCNGFVAATDFGQFFVPKFKNAPGAGGNKPGPSGLACAGTPGCQ